MRALLLVFLCFPILLFSESHSFPKIDPAAITIVRDSFGTPHIFAKTDAEVAYGLAWANAEDAFLETQNLVYAAKGFMGRKSGIEGVKADFFVHAIGARKIVEERYASDLTPEFLKYLDGFVQGLNSYAAAHPAEVKVRKAFPVTDKDVLTAYVIVMSYLVGVQSEVGDAVGGKYDQSNVDFHTTPTVGSNAYACNPVKTVDGKTYLCINPHIAMNGAFSFYEAHLQSEEGLAMVGNMFQFGTSHAMGTNPHLGWGFTWNYFDRVDVFRLHTDKHKKGKYEFDGEWLKMEKRPVWLKVNLSKKGKFVLPVRKMTYWTKYGCTLKSDKADLFYAIRYPANMNIKAGQQLYEMARSKNYQEFWQALRHNHAIALFNMVYADEKNNIFYLSHGEMPDRKNQTFNWKGVVPGNSSQTLWTSLIPIDSMPHVINPKSGYVFNANNNVYSATAEGENDNPVRLPANVNERAGDNNRAELLKAFFKEHDKVTFEAFEKVKFGTRFPKESVFLKSLEPLWTLKPEAKDSISDITSIIQNWDRNTDTGSTATAAFAAFINEIWDKRGYDDEQFVTGFKLTPDETVKCLKDAKKYLLETFGALEMPWGSIHRLRRGDRSLPMPGFPDLLSPSYPKPYKINGKVELNPEYGDTYTMFVRYGKNGAEEIETLMPLGNSVNPASKHYNDQMENFLARKMKRQSFDQQFWMNHAESVYHPK
ncbi:MAG: penicillin acylase family protein [Chitinophagales bacterium]